MIRMDAPLEAVWKLLTEPVFVEQYFFGAELRTSWNVGDPITFSGTWEGKAYEHRGTVLAYEPGKRLAYTHTDDAITSTVTYLVEMDGTGTRVTITQDNCPTVDHRDRCMQHWQQVLQSAKKVVEQA